MLLRKMLMGAVLALLLALMWKYLVAGRMNTLVPEQALPATLKQEITQAKEMVSNAGHDAQVQSPAGIHKCKVGNMVTYTDEPCKNPATERPLGKGSVTVVKSERPAATVSPEHRERLPNVRDLAGPQGEPSITDKQIERAINH